MPPQITRESALIFRITHRDNVPWILRNGLHSPNSTRTDPGFVSIGRPEIIETRRSRLVPVPPGGTLADYVPFYFTPYSPMMYNIVTGFGVTRLAPKEIVIITTSLPALVQAGKAFVFTDQHAVSRLARFYREPADLDRIDWPLIRARDFRRDNIGLDGFERYQAEALVRDSLEVDLIEECVCYDQGVSRALRAEAARHGVDTSIRVRGDWYF